MNAYQKAMLIAKLQHHNLNMFYSCGFEPNADCNWRIEQLINSFLYTYKDKLETHTFILEYQDDTISLICYRMLKAISAIEPINIILYGKCKKTKKLLPKEQKKIGRIGLKRKLKKDNNIIFISSFNPLYKVASKEFNSTNLGYDYWYPMKSFTPDQLKILRVFYHIDYIKNDIIDDKIYTKNFQSWCDNQLTGAAGNPWLDMKFPFIEEKYNCKRIIVVNLTSSLATNKLLLQAVENTDAIVLYKMPEVDNYKQKEINEQLKQYALFIKYHSNTYGYYNIITNEEQISNYSTFLNCEIDYLNENNFKEIDK